MERIKHFSRNTFLSLKIRNYRLYFIGQSISLSGTWMQTVALGWLVLELTHSGTILGIVVALQFLPMLILGPWGGLVADRYNKRHILFFTQSAFLLLTLAMSILLFAGSVPVSFLYIFALCFGIIRIFDNPARQTFVSELVGSDHLKNAVSLNATVNNLARAVGPSIAGILIAGIGTAFCFFFNSMTYLATIIMLLRMRTAELFPAQPSKKRKGEIKEGFRYVMSMPLIRNTLFMMAIIGTFVYEFNVSLPILAENAFHGDAKSYAMLLTAMGIGSVIGGLFAASRKKVSPHHLKNFIALFGLSLLAVSLMPTLALATAGMFVVGFFSINVTSLANTMIQLESDPAMRGRVMALWGMAMQGSTPIGGPIIGYIGHTFGGRWTIAVASIACFAVYSFASFSMKQRQPEDISEEVQFQADKAASDDTKVI